MHENLIAYFKHKTLTSTKCKLMHIVAHLKVISNKRHGIYFAIKLKIIVVAIAEITKGKEVLTYF